VKECYRSVLAARTRAKWVDIIRLMAQEPAEAPPASSVRVLAVDDDAALCRRLASALAAVGYQVMTAHDADRAIAQATDTPPDIAIVDLGLPTSGHDLIRRLKQDAGPSCHVIVLTGSDDEANRMAAFEAGADDYVVKPVPPVEIKRRLAAASRRQRAYVELRLQKEATDRRLVYGSEATALLAHDLNNGLAVALSNLQYLIEEIEPANTDSRDAMIGTLRSLRKMSSLVANFVDIARFEDAAVKPAATRDRIRPLLAAVLDTNAPSFAPGVDSQIDCNPELEGRFDQALIERVLHNLVGNASRYCKGPGRILIAARRLHDTDSDSVLITVANTGPLITTALADNLFSKYARGSGGKRGMGLYFCKLVAEAHGGRIDYEPTEIGPSFAIRLPGHA
jgi:DNA-binding response OmpR family regulator